MGWWHCRASLAHGKLRRDGAEGAVGCGVISVPSSARIGPPEGSALVLEFIFPAFWNAGIVGLGFWALGFRQEQQTQVATIFQALAVARGGSQQGDPGDAALGQPEGIQEHGLGGKPKVDIQEVFGH